MAIVEVKDLVKTFPAHRSLRAVLRHPFDQPQTGVLNGVDLTLERQQIVGVLGSNGAGKTTLLKVIATLIAPTSGSVTVDGWDVETAIRKARSSVAYCFTEERSFYWRLTGRQNLEFFAALRHVPPQTAGPSIERLAGRLGMADHLDRPFGTLSTGQRQALAIMRGLIDEPSIVFMDEPTRSLDPISAGRLRRFVADVVVGELGRTVVLATHSMPEAEEL
ncbi:MAG TPA: ABC transporter ATP-binding protein, partial [Dehalococcoidia bacterium]|nr:ABC transporter ATP-binding protein [Dehalococcoidia bacterium]